MNKTFEECLCRIGNYPLRQIIAKRVYDMALLEDEKVKKKLRKHGWIPVDEVIEIVKNARPDYMMGSKQVYSRKAVGKIIEELKKKYGGFTV